MELPGRCAVASRIKVRVVQDLRSGRCERMHSFQLSEFSSNDTFELLFSLTTAI